MKSESVYKIPLFSALIVTLIAVPLRVYQYFKIINPETGFFDKIDASVFILYILSVLAIVCAISVPLINRKKMITVSTCKKSTGFLTVSIIAAVSLVVDSAIQLMDYFDLYASSTGMSQTVSEYVNSQGGNLILLQIIFGGISAIFFFILGLTVGLGNSDGSKFKVIALSPTVYSVFKLLYRFKRTISFVNVSDLLIELFLVVFTMLFFLAYAQVISKIDAPAVFWKIFGYGIPTVMLGLICFIPRVIVVITGHSELLSEHYGIHFSDCGLAVFIIYNLITRAKSQFISDKE